MNEFIESNLQLFAQESAPVQAQTITPGSDTSEGQPATGTEGQPTPSNTDTQDKSLTFNNMINGEYKSEYQASLESALSRRLKTRDKKIAEYEAFNGQVSPLLDKLAVKYGIDDASDITAIMQAAENDDSYYEEYALNRGVDVKTAKELIKAERITAENERRIADEQMQNEFNQKYADWLSQAADVKQKYPAFDFEYESANEKTGESFRRLLNSGVDVETAYTVIHRNEIMGGAIQYAYKTAQREIADSRTARQSRANENGTSSQQASSTIDDWSKLSRAEREKINAAVRKGEKVSPENFRKFL